MKIIIISTFLIFFIAESFAQSSDSANTFNISANKKIDSTTNVFIRDLTILKQKDSITVYCNKVMDLYKYLVASKKSISIFDKSSIFELWREPITNEEFLIFRNFQTFKGYVYDIKLGDYIKSREAYEQALALDSQINDSKYHWFILNPLANVYTRLGDYENAIILFEECEKKLLAKNELSNLNRMYVNMAKVYVETKNINKAKEVCLKVIKSKNSSTKGIVNSLLFLANIYYSEDSYDATKETLLKLKIPLKDLHKETSLSNSEYYYYERIAEFFKLKSLLTFEENKDESFKHFNKSIEYLEKAFQTIFRRDFGKFFNAYNSLLINSGEYNSAFSYANKALIAVIPKYNKSNTTPLDTQLYPENTIQEALTLKGKAYELKYEKTKNKSDLQKANECYNSALKVAQLLRKEYVFNDSKYIALKDNKELVEASLNNYYKLNELDKKNSYYYQILEIFQISKAYVLTEKRDYTFALKQMNDDQKLRYSILNKKIDTLSSNKNTEYLNYLDEKKKFLDELVAGTKMSKKISSNYIDYFVGDKNTYALVNTDLQKNIFLLGSSNKLEALINNSKFLRTKSYSEYDKFNSVQNELYKFLIKPLGELPRQIRIIPDDFLASISFESLINSQGKFLIEDHILSYHYDANENESIKINNQNKSIVFSPEYIKNKNPSSTQFRDKLYEIPFAKKEAKAIENIINSNVFLGKDANKLNFKDKISECNILHFAGHAVLDSLKQTYLAFSSFEEKSSQLFTNELDTFYLALDLLTLSACNTASGKIQPGEGTFSLARAFHGIGAESIVSTLWEISDQTSSDIMISFYKNLKKGQTKDEALRNAKLKFIENADPDYKHPYYWAGIVAMGDMSPLYKKPIPKYYYLIGSVFILLGFGFLYNKKTKNKLAA